MTPQKALLHRLARALSEKHPIDPAEFFTEDFRLHDPGAGKFPAGYDGTRQMLDGIRAFAPDLKVHADDMIEEQDRVAVRWRFTGTRDGKPATAIVVAIYRFAHARIAEDWGISARSDWP